MASRAQVHVIRKDDIAQHASIHTSISLPALDAVHVRARTAITCLTANNLSYAKGGTMLRWWDTYPVPSHLPAPYNDPSQWGTCPCWGYGEVLESRHSDFEPGMLIWGFWPTSNLPVDLKLVPGPMNQLWAEESEHRMKLMSIYNRYSIPDASARLADMAQEKLDEMAWEAVFTIWGCAYLLNRYNLASPAVHPFGSNGKTPWTAEDSDISQAVVINLSAGGKTAVSFADALINDREPGTGPLGLLSITGSSGHISTSGNSFPTKTVSYDAMTDNETLKWIALQNPSKIVVCDFGGRGDSFIRLQQALEQQFSGASIMSIGIGGEAKPMSAQEMGAWAKQIGTVKSRTQMNTSDVRDAAIALVGAEAFYEQSKQAWRAFVDRGNLKSMKLVWGAGVDGENGLEGGWERLCRGDVPSDVGLVYRV